MPGKATSDHGRALQARPLWRRPHPGLRHPERGPLGRPAWCGCSGHRPACLGHHGREASGTPSWMASGECWSWGAGCFACGCQRNVDIHLTRGWGTETRSYTEVSGTSLPRQQRDPSTSAVQTQRPTPTPSRLWVPALLSRGHPGHSSLRSEGTGAPASAWSSEMKTSDPKSTRN